MRRSTEYSPEFWAKYPVTSWEYRAAQWRQAQQPVPPSRWQRLNTPEHRAIGVGLLILLGVIFIGFRGGLR